MVSTTVRKSQGVRREEILAAAVEEFGEHGYHGGSTEGIARRAGISQPYVFRLFGTKQELFKAVVTTRLSSVTMKAAADVRANAHIVL